MMRRLLVVAIVALCGEACVRPVSGILTSEERRIWVIRGVHEVYRCADANGPEAPPRPVCVAAPFTGGAE